MNDLAESWQRFFIEITNRCNFDCVFCTSGISKRAKHDMHWSIAFNLIDQLQELGFNKTIYFHVLGEPLLHPSVFAIVDHAAEAGMRPVIFTNGGALTSKVVQDILASKTKELVISMQTINRQSYQRLRKTPFDWSTYLNRIQTALATANDAENNCTFRVSIGIKKVNTQHPEDLYFLEYESLEQIKESIANIFSKVKGVGLTGVFSKLDVHGPLGMPTIQITDFLSLSVKPMGNWRRLWRDGCVTSGHCLFFGKELAVLSNGAVTFCHIDYDGRTTIGNIRERPLMDIINMPETKRMVNDFIAGRSVAKGCEYCNAVRNTHGRSAL